MKQAPEIIAFHLGQDIQDIKDGLYQYHTPSVYTHGDDYYCCPRKGQKPPVREFSETEWVLSGEEYGRKIYRMEA